MTDNTATLALIDAQIANMAAKRAFARIARSFDAAHSKLDKKVEDLFHLRLVQSKAVDDADENPLREVYNKLNDKTIGHVDGSEVPRMRPADRRKWFRFNKGQLTVKSRADFLFVFVHDMMEACALRYHSWQFLSEFNVFLRTVYYWYEDTERVRVLLQGFLREKMGDPKMWLSRVSRTGNHLKFDEYYRSTYNGDYDSHMLNNYKTLFFDE